MEIANLLIIDLSSDYEITISKMDGTPVTLEDEMKLIVLGDAFKKYTLLELEEKLK